MLKNKQAEIVDYNNCMSGLTAVIKWSAITRLQENRLDGIRKYCTIC